MARISDDELLRKWGFSIESRPKRGEAVWRRDGNHYPHNKAMQVAVQEEKMLSLDDKPAKKS